MRGRIDLRLEPYRIFFPLGIVFGVMGVGHWLAYAHGWIDGYSGLYHSQLQAGGFVGCFILGFLMTMLPRSAGAPLATTTEVGVGVALVVAQAVGLSLSIWPLALLAFSGVLLFIALFAVKRFARRRTNILPPTEFVWVPIAVVMGLIGSVLMVLGWYELAPAWLLRAGASLTQQGFVLCIVLGVGGFLAPRLMGPRHYDAPRPLPAAEARRHAVRRARLHGVAAIFLLASFLIEGTGAVRAAYLLRAGVVTIELLWTVRIHLRPVEADLYVRYLWMSLWSVVLGLWGAGLFPLERVVMLHIAFIGGFSLMIFSIATMVVLSHAGERKRLQGPLKALRIVAICLIGALLLRFASETSADHYFDWLGAASTLWLVGAVTWLVFVLPRLTRTVAPQQFEKVHAEAKKRLLTS